MSHAVSPSRDLGARHGALATGGGRWRLVLDCLLCAAAAPPAGSVLRERLRATEVEDRQRPTAPAGLLAPWAAQDFTF